MKTLWAPWRMDYLRGDVDPVTGCLFCINIDKAPSVENLIIYKGDHTFVMLNKYPYSNGHLLIAPIAHLSSIDELSEAAVTELAIITQVCVKTLRCEYNPDGFNIGVNMGSAAGAGVPDHVHTHVLPRWSGDTNFMTSIAETRVLPEEIGATYIKLQKTLVQIVGKRQMSNK
ncbi:MAG: HIT family hydrolase [Chloroflexi bacterium]|nr:HIT family hydrolase [Chloroflexota bacterium]HCU81279.1 HIT family hydrolase [Chloroflexota bacterium]